MSFDIHSNFDKRANFTEVKFGEGKPVLEVELNELQNIQNEARADLIRDSIPSGFTSLGELDFAYSAINENVIRLKSESVAYVNGYRILLPKGMTIDLGEAPKDKPREDLVFLEVWREEVNYEDTLHTQGGENLGTITNPIKDSRYPIETSRRVALKWRIRVQQNVDFNKYVDGFATSHSPKYWADINPDILPQGALSSPTKLILGGLSNWVSSKIREGTTQSNLASIQGDTGVYAGGLNTRTTLGTIDGFVYAIPMFRIKRKPSCGKASPFEYSKINPKVDYDKFTNLVNEDKVERVISENIKGNSLRNLLPHTDNFTGSGVIKEPNDVVKLTQTGATEYFQATELPITQNTKYSLIYEVVESTVVEGAFCLAGDTSNNIVDTGVTLTSNIGRHCVVFTSSQTNIDPSRIRFAIKSNSPEGTYVKFKHPILLVGDWSTKLPDYFLGLKSVGEDENNLLELKMLTIDKDIYDPCSGNVKLSSAPNVTHVMTGNAISPTFEAEVKIGGLKVSNLNEFKKLDTQGDETIEFTKVKGKTLQNLIKNKWSIASSTTDALKSESIPNGVKITKVKETLTWAYALFGGDFVPFLKPSTIYTFFMDIKSSTTLADSLTYNICSSNGLNALGTVTFKKLTGDTYVCKYTSPETIVAQNQGLYISLSGYPVNSWLEVSNLMLIEGDHTTDNVPYFPSMSSVGENEDNTVIVKSCGKNMFNMYDFCDMLKPYDKYADIKEIDGKECLVLSGYSYYKDTNVQYLKGYFKPNTSYTFSGYSKKLGDKDSILILIRYTDSTEATITNVTSSEWREFSFVSDGEKTIDCILISYNYKDYLGALHSFQIEEGVKTPYESYQGKTQEIQLKEPLRKVSDIVYDEIVGNKVIRRVGKLDLSDPTSLKMNSSSGNINDNRYGFTINNIPVKLDGTAFCDTLPIVPKTQPDNVLKYCYVATSVEAIVLVVPKSEMVSIDLNGARDWLKKNPTTIYYELATPIIEPIEHYYDKESVKTYQLDSPLRRVDNNIIDIINNNVVDRRCGEVILNGEEKWIEYSTPNETTMCFSLTIDDKQIGYTNLVCDRLTVNYNAWKETCITRCICGNSNNEKIFCRVLKTDLKTQNVDGFKEWLKQKPLKIVYELKIPKKTVLFESTNSITQDVNSYLGNLYVGDGTNELYLKSTIPWVQNLVAETSFRQIKNLAIVDDCHYKKHYDGYELEPRGKGNILDTRGFTYFDIIARAKNECPFKFYAKLKSPNVKFTLFSDSQPITNVNIAIKGMNKNGELVDWIAFHPTINREFTFKNYRDIEYFIIYTNDQITSSLRIDGVCMTYADGDSSTLLPYEPYYEAFENLDHSDICDLRNQVSLTGLNYQNILTKSFDKLLRGEL